MANTMLDNNKTRSWHINALSMTAPAKLNLSLVVFSRRADGFHELHTVMGMIDFADRLDIRRSKRAGIHLTTAGLDSPVGKDNLVTRAAALLAKDFPAGQGVELHLTKHIPAGGGLGGASSDAATCLMGINRLFDLQLSQEELAELAGQLGSDVPFFLYGPYGVCTGRGEKITPLPSQCGASMVLIIPRIHVPTPRVYQHYHYDETTGQSDYTSVQKLLDQGDLDGLVRLGVNSLTTPAMELFPELNQLRGELNKLGVGPMHMSGSGACLFSVAGNHHQAQQWQEQLQRANLVQVAEVKIVRFLNQHNPYLEVHHADI